ncbi:DNA-3-methyladenine glycosylase II [Salirhabdus euzebyi]|uniref:DNA-3-methyladenine glycosylase II n=1 Tax=Salirhabdus euzebyi TaxID=394506 RepID=A0A841QAJ8_9BACI|nr:DNA-3-methyladenine glycosylase [Salirhabdus euzebyi]MBB6455426.1 DNA-3-methyladenine glycosylase II [Salirhabdus euzebyi]
MWLETIVVDGSFDFDYALSRFAFDPLLVLSVEERWVHIPMSVKGEKHVVKLQATGTTNSPAFIIQSESFERKEDILRRVKAIFQWEKDLETIHSHFEKTNLAHLFQKYPGTPVVKDFGLYEALVKTIIHQQLNMRFAYTLSTRFVQLLGEEKDGSWFYPTPEKVASINYEELRELQFSQRKAEYVIDTSRLIASGELNLEKLAEQPDEQVIEKLTKIRGVGTWTAENWLLFGLGRENLLPAADIGIQNGLKKYLNMDAKPKKEEIYEMGEQWSPFRSYASLTIWRSTEG